MPIRRVRSLGFRTDLMLRGMAGSSIVEHAGHLVVRTPANPGFWWGNFVLLTGPPAQADALAVFAGEFPAATHVAIGVDSTDGTLGDGGADLGLTVEVNAVLTAQHLRPPSPDTDVRALSSDEDWTQATSLRLACYYEAPTPDERQFTELQVLEQRRLCEAGHGTWFGAFVQGRMCSGAGLFSDGRLARFQSVETHPDFRRRGLAAAVIRHAARREPDANTLVIVADPDDHAIQLYRTLGFAEVERQVQLYRAPES
ncbi:GNAT family N-acetyltransferase [Dactylosporangium sp. NPDC051541]|uniref:GNAT family N-acetyltransferase n=1 Tax=Dactylosporangium sp. NPDC051541 TaxID=3363977 RepID=UPI00378B8C2B